MNVVYLISRTKRAAGPINQAYYIITGLNRIPGVNARLISIAPEIIGNSWLDRFIESGITVHQLNHSPFEIIKSIKALKKYIKENNIDVVHSASYKSDFVNMFLRKHVKTVSTQRCLPNEIVEGFPKLIRPPFEKIHLNIIKKLDSVVACSQSLKKAFEEDYNINAEAVQNGVDTDYFTPVPKEEKKMLRKQLKLSENKMVFLVLGSFRARKNVGLIIDAIRLLDEQNIELVIVGSGSQEKELKEKAHGDERIIFTGMVTNARDYLQASDILVSSSLAEGLPNTVLESIACGLPCILSDIGPHREIMKDEKMGVLFDKNSSNELAQKMKESIKWDLEEKSKYVRSIAEEKFSIDTLAKNYLSIYQK